VIEQAVASVGSLDQKRIGDYIKTHSFETIVGKIEYAPNGEWKNPRMLRHRPGEIWVTGVDLRIDHCVMDRIFGPPQAGVLANSDSGMRKLESRRPSQPVRV
jgi:hypothetical protein